MVGWQTDGLRVHALAIVRRVPAADSGRRVISVPLEHGAGTLIDNVTPARRAAFETLGTVEGQLAQLRRALEQRPDSADIAYNPRLGYPVRVRIDMRRYVSDDVLGFSISGFKVLSQMNRLLPNHVLQPTGGSCNDGPPLVNANVRPQSSCESSTVLSTK